MTTEFKVLGLDVSKSNVTCHILDSYPKGGLKTYWDKTRNKASTLYPVFYSNPKKKLKQKSGYDFADYLKANNPNVAIIEPTGNHYARLWASIIKSLGIQILWVGHVELRRYRGGKNLPNKSDSADALAMAAYGHDEDHKLENGELNLKYFLMHRPESIDKIRELCQQLEHLNRVQSPIINHARQLLAWQFPEVAHSKSKSSAPGRLPPLWAWLANRQEISPAGATRLNNLYKNSIARDYQIEIEQFLRLHANWLCDIALEEQAIESDLKELLKLDEFKPYNEVFDKFGFGLRVRARLMSRIYPFEGFLGLDGKEVIEYEMREVKKTGDEKRVKRNRSRDTFKIRVGMGTVLEQSGDNLIEKASGSALCRMSFWQYVLCQLETNKLPENDVTKKLNEYREKLKSATNEQGEKLLNGKHLQGKLMAKVANLMYSELVKNFVKR